MIDRDQVFYAALTGLCANSDVFRFDVRNALDTGHWPIKLVVNLATKIADEAVEKQR